jgi:signal transduction histidine kinase/ligand-binding sensor domain-containing protein
MVALDPHTLISQFGHTAWRAQEGFPGQASAITQTSDGYIWIVAEHSLFRFDGVRFLPWTPPNNQSLPNNGVTAVLGAGDGSLWIGTAGGLAHWKEGRLTNYTTTPTGAGISSILEDHTGKIWVTRYRVNDGMGPLCWVKGSALECYGEKEGNPALFGLGITEDSTGDIWFTSTILYRRHQGSFAPYFGEHVKNATAGEVMSVLAAPSGEIWATLDGTGPKAGVQHFSDGKWESYIVPGFDGRNFKSDGLFVDRKQTVWIGTRSNGLYHIHDGVADHYGSADGLSGDNVSSLYEDAEGNLWVGTESGIDLFRDTAVIDFAKAQGLLGGQVHAILTVNGGDVWVANEQGVSVIQATPFSPILHQMLAGHNVESMFVDSKGQVWLGVDHRVVAYKNGQYVEARKADGSALGPVGNVSSFAEDTEGNLWVLGSVPNDPPHADLFLIRDQRVRQEYRLEDSKTAFVAADPRDGIWAAARSKIIHYVGGRAQESVQLSGNQGGILGLDIDSHNAVWANTTKGLYRWSDGQLTQMGVKNGLPCSRIFSWIQDDQSSRWIRTECGILRVSADEWERWLKSPGSKVPFVLFNALDGAHPGFLASSVPTSTKSRDGKLWFASESSVQMVNPNRESTSLSAPVHIEEVVADHKTYDPSDRVALPRLRGELEIDYTALSFKIPQRVLFRYKLEGHDEDWQEVGTRRQAFYNDLPPRKYRFRVIACNSDGVWNEVGTFIDFSIRPAWYQTSWFRFCCVAAFLLLLWAAYVFRVRQLESQFAAGLETRVDERTRIARELHDTLLQSFQGAVFQFQAARRLFLRNADNVSEAMDEAIQAAEVGITEGRAAIQNLRPEPAAQRNLPELLNAACSELAIAQELNGLASDYQVLVEGKQRDLSSMLQDEVYRISREAIRNAFAHAAAVHIEVEIRYDQDQLRVRIRDDGKGIDPKTLEDRGRPGHWGITGMRERAQRIGAQLAFWSEVGAGTEVQLTVPGAIAYEKHLDGNRFR